MDSTDIWEKGLWVNDYIDLETLNDVFDSEAWEIDSKTEEESSEDGEWRMIRKKKFHLRESV